MHFTTHEFNFSCVGGRTCYFYFPKFHSLTGVFTYYDTTTTFLCEVTDENVLGSSSKIRSLRHHGLLHGLHAVDDHGRFWSDEETVDVPIALPQLGKSTVRRSFHETLPNAIDLLLILTQEEDLLFTIIG